MNELVSILTELRPGKDFSAAKNFFDEGLLDSLDLTTLVSALESRYGVFVDVDEMIPENFQSLAAIQKFLAGKGVEI
jgi:acyl carrier protein